MSQSFVSVAPHYEELMSHVPYSMWVGYYQLLQAQLGVEHRRLLDVCCGTGTVAGILASEGYQVTGVDLSADMISEARRLRPEIEFHVANAKDMDLGARFEGAYSFFDSFNYITEPDDLRLAIEQVARHLGPGGSLVFDMNTAYAFEKKMFDQKETRKSAPIRYDWVGEYDAGTKLIRVDMRFERNGATFEEIHWQRAYETDEILGWLELAGFGEVLVYDSYTLQPPRRKSDRLHFAASLV